MERRINYRKRRKGLLATVICMALLTGLLHPPIVVEAVSNKTVTVVSADTQILVGEGDSITFTNGVYGNVAIGSTRVFPTSGNEDVKIVSGGQAWDGTLFATDKLYTIPSSSGLYQGSIILYDRVDLYQAFNAQGGSFVPSGIPVDKKFAYVTLTEVAGCKIDYMQDGNSVAFTEYVLADDNGVITTEIRSDLTKENAELLGWSTSADSANVEYEFGTKQLNGGNGLLVLYPVWEVTAPEPEPAPVPSTPAPKSAGIVNVSMNGYTFGGNSSNPMIVSSTNDVSRATVTYKAAGASDATYSTQKPTTVGDYVVRVALPENDNYGQAVGTANFRISYLPAPTPAYELDGTKGDNGWYKSEVEITPPDGYEMSVGNRDHFTTESYTVDEETSNLRIYLRKITTGEMTDVISIANLRVDADAPTFTEMQDGEEYYEDSVTVDFTDRHFKTVTVNGEVMEVVTDENGEYSFAVETGMRRMSYVIVLKDEAGNETKVSMIFGPAWLKDGIVGEGDYYLETGEEYHFPIGSGWVKSGDNTVYAGGSSFYANSEGGVTFGKE